MTAYLYTWNPDQWTWTDQGDAIYRVLNDEDYEARWSCGNTKKIAIGDTVFLMRLGVNPKGIVGCGYVSSTPYQSPHWDSKKASQGRTALSTNVLFKALCDEPIISLAALEDRYPAFRWTPQTGGVTVPDVIARDILEEIQRNDSTTFASMTSVDLTARLEGRRRRATVQVYDRNAEARQECIAYYGYNCTICGFNFEKTYGRVGSKYVEVHHLRQVADAGGEYVVNATVDLRPVCANCHRMLHTRRPPLSIDELRAKLTDSEASETP